MNSSATTIDGRSAAYERLIERARRFPAFDPTAQNMLWAEALPQQERSLAIAIEQVAARHWLTLVFLLERQLRQPWQNLEPAMQAALLGGAAQLFFLDRIPDHAAISETVQWAKTRIRPGAGKMTNAVLRRASEMRVEIVDAFDRDRHDHLPLPDGRAWQLAEAIFTDDPIARIAEQTGHQPWMVARWISQFGDQRTIDLALHSMVHAPVVLTGPRGTPPPIEIERVHVEPGFHIAAAGAIDSEAEIGGKHAWRVQDAGTAKPLGLTKPLKPALIVDACAGRGTKTHQLRQLHPKSRIIATDVNDHRRTDLQRTFQGVESVEVVEPGALRGLIGQVDLLVLDVPCSNSGVLARRVEAKHRVRERDMQKLIDTQRQIIADSLTLLAPAGHLLYATCSIDESENEQQARWINQWHHMPITAECRTLPEGVPGGDSAAYHDGGYGALLASRQS